MRNNSSKGRANQPSHFAYLRKKIIVKLVLTGIGLLCLFVYFLFILQY